MKPRAKQRVALLAFTFAGALAPQFLAAQTTVTNYSAGNFNTNLGYVRGFGIISTNQPAALRWQGNDPYNPVADTGETDLVARASGYTPSPLANSSLLQGGLGVADGILPGTTDVEIWKTFSPSSTPFAPDATVSFFAEWSIIGSSPLNAPYTNSDTFAFDLRNAANSQSLLKLQFTPGINILSNAYTLQTIATDSPTDTVIDLGYGSLFQVQVDMVASSFNLSLARLDPSTRAIITNYNNLASGSLSTGLSALDFATISLDWELASTNNLLPGSNYMLANQFQVSTSGTVIPEPGTWVASLLLLAIGGAYYIRRRLPALSDSPLRSKMSHLHLRLLPLLAGMFLLCGASLRGQEWSAEFFNTNAGYLRGSGVVSTFQPSDVRWQGNDLYNPGTGLGETDLVARASGYTPSPLANSSLFQGGLGVADSVLPGTNNVQIWKTFGSTGSSTVSFFAEWSIIGSTLSEAPYTNSDTFSFDLRNAANTDSLLTLQFTPGINILSNAYTLQTIAAGSPTDTVIDLGYGSLFQVQVDINASSYDLSLARLDPATRTILTNFSNLTSGSLSAGTTAEDLATVGIDWILSSGDNLDPGSNYILVNEISVVPEPSTYAMLGLASVVVLGALVRRRRA